jgi:hypothetical protein
MLMALTPSTTAQDLPVSGPSTAENAALIVYVSRSGFDIWENGQRRHERQGCPVPSASLCLRKVNIDVSAGFANARSRFAAGDTPGTREAVRAASEAYDWRTLYNTLVRLKSASKHTHLYVAASPEIPSEVLGRVSALAGSRLEKASYETAKSFAQASRGRRTPLFEVGLFEGGEGSQPEFDHATKTIKALAAMTPVIVPGQPTAQGSLSAKVIHRVVRAHRKEIAHCYKLGLMGDPTLQGTVTIRFTISPTGNVVLAKIADSDVKDEEVATCIAGRVRNWVFPEPRGGDLVKVRFPFKLRPGKAAK